MCCEIGLCFNCASLAVANAILGRVLSAKYHRFPPVDWWRNIYDSFILDC